MQFNDRNEGDIVNPFQRKSMSARDDKFTSAREWITIGHRKSKIFAVDAGFTIFYWSVYITAALI